MSTQLRNQRRTTLTLVIAATCVAGAFLSACSTDTQATNQTQGESDSSLIPTPTPSQSLNRQASLYRDSQICVVNNSSNIITVNFSKKDASFGEGVIQPKAGIAGQACANGWFRAAYDVEGTITTIKPDSLLTMVASNGALQLPYVLGYPGTFQRACIGAAKVSVGDTKSWDSGLLKFTSLREEDSSDFIRFRIEVTDTEDPVADGIARTSCSD